MQQALYHAVLMFGCCLVAHVIVWRAFRVRHEGARLGLIFVVLPLLFVAGRFLIIRLNRFMLVDEIDWLLAFILHSALSGSYLFFYTAVTGFSPSIAILEKVEQSMPQGLARQEIAPAWFTDKHLTGARLANLLATGFIVESRGSLSLSGRGRIIARIFLIFRTILGLPGIADG